MSKNVLVISASLRGNSNSEALADAFIAGARKAGNQVEKVTLKEKTLAFCKGCLACQQTQKCVIQDDAAVIAEKMRKAEAIAFATPIYFYEMCGQMKTLLDRTNPLFLSAYAFRNIYMLATAAENTAQTPEKAAGGLNGWIDCFEKAALSGVVFAGGVNAAGEIEGHPSLKTAYDMGAAIQ